MISADILRKYVNQSKAFQIFLADGRQVEVPHGEYLALHPNGRMFILFTPRAFEIFNLTMVTSVRAAGGAANEQNQEK